MQDGRGRSRRKAVKNDGHPLLSRGKDGTCNRCKFAPANTPQCFQRILQILAVESQSAVYDSRFARDHRIIRAGPRSDPLGAAPAKQRCEQGGGDRGIADSQIANAEQIGVGYSFHPERHGGRARTLIESCILRDIRSRKLESKVEHLEPEIGGNAELIYRCAAGRGQFHKLGGRHLRAPVSRFFPR